MLVLLRDGARRNQGNAASGTDSFREHLLPYHQAFKRRLTGQSRTLPSPIFLVALELIQSVPRGQWAAVNGDDILLVAAVWTVHSNYLVVCGRRNSKRDADQPASPQQTVRGSP